MSLGRALTDSVNQTRADQPGSAVDDEENDKPGRHFFEVLHLFSGAILNAVGYSA